MTVMMLDELDPDGEVKGWLGTIAEMVTSC